MNSFKLNSIDMNLIFLSFHRVDIIGFCRNMAVSTTIIAFVSGKFINDQELSRTSTQHQISDYVVCLLYCVL